MKSVLTASIQQRELQLRESNIKDCAVQGVQVQMDSAVEHLYHKSEVVSLFSLPSVSQSPGESQKEVLVKGNSPFGDH